MLKMARPTWNGTGYAYLCAKGTLTHWLLFVIETDFYLISIQIFI